MDILYIECKIVQYQYLTFDVVLDDAYCRSDSLGRDQTGTATTSYVIDQSNSRVIGTRHIQRCWLNLSQQPKLLRLQQRLYTQIAAGGHMPKETVAEIEDQLSELQEAAKEKKLLIVLDDLCELLRHS